MPKASIIPVSFAVMACSWMPHWACHYYRLETHSNFVVGSFEFSRQDSVISMVIYSILIVLNLLSVSVVSTRFIAAILSGLLHLTLGVIHIIRLLHPFTFQVFGYDWQTSSSLREIFIVIPFALFCFWIAWKSRVKKATIV